MKINSIYAVISEEGIVGIKTPEGRMPLVFCDKKMLDHTITIVEQLSKETNHKLRIMKFKREKTVYKSAG